MKREGNIYNKMCDPDLIRQAIINASKRKRKRKNVQRILSNLDAAVKDIRQMLIHGTFKPSPPRIFTIKDGISQKERLITCPRFYPDQVIHWVIILALQPVFMRGMYKYTCGSVPGRGVHYGKGYIERWMERDRKNTKYCLKLDIKKFYPSIKAPVMMRELRRMIKCTRTLEIIEAILLSTDGLPIGYYTSQWFANAVLQRLDHYIKEQMHIKYYVRYMDDMVLMGRNKKVLHKARQAVAEFLKEMGLALKSNWQVFPIDKRGLDFLGFRFFRGYTILRKPLALRLRRRIKKAWRRGKITPADAAAIVSYMGWLKHANMQAYFDRYVRPYINIKKLKEVIRLESKKHSKAAFIFNRGATVCA